LPSVAAGKIGSADRSGKQRIAGKQQLLPREEEADATRCVSWGVNHFSRQGGEANGQAIVGAGVRRRYFGRGNAEPTGLHLHRPQQTEILFIEKNRRSGHLLKQGRSAYVVDVSVGDDNLPQGEAMLLQPGEDLRNVVSGIDDDGVMRSLIAQDGAIAAQRSYGKTFEDHLPILDADYNAAMRIYATVGAFLCNGVADSRGGPLDPAAPGSLAQSPALTWTVSRAWLE
jgi:hypothetical protein